MRHAYGNKILWLFHCDKQSTETHTNVMATIFSSGCYAPYRPYPRDHFALRHSLPDGKAHECPLAAVYTAVSGEA